MVEINIRNKEIQLEEFKVERTYDWNKETHQNDIIPKTCIIIKDISKTLSDEMKSLIQGGKKLDHSEGLSFKDQYHLILMTSTSHYTT